MLSDYKNLPPGMFIVESRHPSDIWCSDCWLLGARDHRHAWEQYNWILDHQMEYSNNAEVLHAVRLAIP